MDLRPHLEVLERFADGEMSAAEQEAFELRLEHEPDLADAHAAFEQLTADVRWAAGHDTLRQRLAVLDQRMNQRSSALQRAQALLTQQQRRWATWSVLGAVVLVLAAGSAWWWWQQSRRDPRAWETYYQPDPGPRVTQALTETRPLFGETLRQYQSGHYSAALHSLNRVSPTSVSLDTLQYYHGLILLRQGQGVGAQPYLRRLADSGSGELARRARYHLGMAYWQAQELAPARATLRQVAADPLNPYRATAARALAARVLE